MKKNIESHAVSDFRALFTFRSSCAGYDLYIDSKKRLDPANVKCCLLTYADKKKIVKGDYDGHFLVFKVPRTKEEWDR